MSVLSRLHDLSLDEISLAPPAVAAPGRTVTPSPAAPMLRMNPMPGRRLSTPLLRATLARFVAAEQRKDQLRDAACDELFALATSVSAAERNQLLAFKRAIYNNRLAPVPSLASELRSVAAYSAAEADSREAGELIEGSYDDQLAAERRALSEQLQHEPFQLALALTSPNVLAACRRYARAAGTPDSRDRKSERGIIQHLSRAMVRTSPLSRFTAVGFGTWAPHAPSLDTVAAGLAEPTAFLSVDRGLFAHLITGLLTVPSGTTLPAHLGMNRTMRTIDNVVRYQQVQQGGITLVAAPLTPALKLLMMLTATGPVPPAALIEAVAERQSMTFEQAAGLVNAAARAQLLVAAPILDEQAVDPIPQAIELLHSHHPELAGTVGEIAAELDRLRSAGPQDRLAALERIEVAADQLNAVTSGPAKVHVNEDYVLEPFQVSPQGVEPALRDLGHLIEFYDLFDRHHVRRRLLAAAFRDLYGSGGVAPLIFEAEALVAAVDAMEGRLGDGSGTGLDATDPALGELFRQRTRARVELTGAVEAGGSDLVRLDPRWLSGLGAALPGEFRAAAASHCLTVQVAANQLIVNDCHAGRGLLGMRFLAHDRALGGAAAIRTGTRVRNQFGGAYRLVEDRGLHKANINHRIQVLDDAIAPVDWLGVVMVHDPASDTLRLLDKDGAPIHPVTLGMKWTDMMPAPLRLAMWLVDSGLIPVDVHERTAQTEAVASDKTVIHPRVQAGQVVMQRRRWFPGVDFPAPAGIPDAQYLLRLSRWRAVHGVADQVVVKTPQARIFGRATEPLGDYLAQRRKEKPQYLDLTSALYVRTLDKLVDRRSAGYFEEALPAVNDGAHAQEWAIEFDRPAFGHFFSEDQS